ncbi:hypothetical protein [Staphylococcus epidermidis]|uniref:hypothetical protein n=1 Tax=Staphylococcus epidermidis TaxID=1282 RepID=UPI00187AAF26|nr:hypothetical protein [Staphylococcus epidermidis]MBE7348632.1 hypothetical protein [Staphylococcus epidermidis]
MAEIKLSIEEYHNLFKGLNTLIKKLYEMAKEGNDYKRQRDELINDMAKLRERNAELERKLDKEIKLSYEIEGNLYDVSKERDKIINDMEEVKRKAEAWDKLKEYVLDKNETFIDRKDYAQSPQQFERFENLLTAFKVIKTKMNDLERGSDE